MSYSPHTPKFARPKAIIYRFLDVFITEGRLKHDYMNIASVHLPTFLEQFFAQKELLDLVEDLRLQSYDEKDKNSSSPVIFKSSQTPTAIIGSVCFYMNWHMKRTSQKADLGKANEPDNKLIKWVIAYALATGQGKITVHDRFVDALKSRHGEGINQYLYSLHASSNLDTDRKLMAFTSAGDLSAYIDGYFSTDLLSPSEQMSYVQMLHCMGGVQPEEVMLVTTSLEECRLAAEAGFKVVKVKRPGEVKNKTFVRVKDMSAMAFARPISNLPSEEKKESHKSNSVKQEEKQKTSKTSAKSEAVVKGNQEGNSKLHDAPPSPVSEPKNQPSKNVVKTSSSGLVLKSKKMPSKLAVSKKVVASSSAVKAKNDTQK